MRHGRRGRDRVGTRPPGAPGNDPRARGPLTAALSLVALAGALPLALGACASGASGSAGEAAATRDRSVPAPGRPTPASGAAGEPAGPEPALVVTGEDLDAVIRSMLAFQDRALRHPDPALPRRWIAAGTRCLADQEETHRFLSSHHGHAEVDRVVESVRVADRPDPHHALLVVTQRNPGARVWTGGHPIPDVLPPAPSTTRPYTLARDPTTMEWRMSCTAGGP